MKQFGCEDRGKQQKDAQRQVSTAVSGNGCNFHGQSHEPGQQEVCPGLYKKGLLISMKIYRCFLTALKQRPHGGISCCTKLSGQKDHLTAHWGREAEASLAELLSPKREAELGMEGFWDAGRVVGTRLCYCGSGNSNRASLTQGDFTACFP